MILLLFIIFLILVALGLTKLIIIFDPTAKKDSTAKKKSTVRENSTPKPQSTVRENSTPKPQSTPKLNSTVRKNSTAGVNSTVGQDSKPKLNSTVGQNSRPKLNSTVGQNSRPKLNSTPKPQSTPKRKSKPKLNSTPHRMNLFETRINDTHIDLEDRSPEVKEIMGKGLLPVKRKVNVGFITSIFDNTSGELEPVLSILNDFQESDNIVFQDKNDWGEISPNQGFHSWVVLGFIPPEILQVPYSGKRDMLAILRMIDLDNPPSITYGFADSEHPGLLMEQSLPFSWTFEEKGYKEEEEHHNEACATALKIGMAIALADGNLDDSEGNTLKKWILRTIEPFSDEKQQELKSLYNKAMKDAYIDAQNDNLILSTLTCRLNEIGTKANKYEAISLCFDVMTADGVADKEEMRIIRKVSEALELDMEEINKMRDKKIIGLDTNVLDNTSIEELLGIVTDWSKEKTKKHLRKEFQKWNNRINTLAEGDERDNAQRMLDLIAEARKKYA